ncbi:hypothetical protein L0P88_12340 [Muricauda sp. SCSIO 64092]|uniref:2OG-Fe(II) oxygenase family protein n=1 Tax=Allomuricauda sp. SCSIO 64092 TaxID=2908842 RepID=UPI001FF6A2F5|nr:2OG-Fe(II) oxygenase family protein [Muricauda sp. SCSIO 64092]UOY04746.1 hypothetical protein L0P88_12340 [Muricauda sp. SCSIO 64092]
MLDQVKLEIDEYGLVRTNIPVFSDIELRAALVTFVKRTWDYRKTYLQKELKVAFDGYSYLGQEDSLNQYSFDQLHSFVISDLLPYSSFPKEFHTFLLQEWEPMVQFLTGLQELLLRKFNIEHLKGELRNNMGYMASCNYYPSLSDKKIKGQRLSTHRDVSFFTVFPFGLDRGLVMQKDGQKQNVGVMERVFAFPGYMAEVMTEGKIKALDHYVEESKRPNKERFSFAFFSIPRPEAVINFPKGEMDGKDYYKQYLSLF